MDKAFLVWEFMMTRCPPWLGVPDESNTNEPYISEEVDPKLIDPVLLKPDSSIYRTEDTEK